MTIVEQLTQRLNQEREQSQLPERTSPDTRQRLEDLLVSARLQDEMQKKISWEKSKS